MINTPKELIQNYIEIGKRKVEMPTRKVFLLAFFAGVFISLGAVGANTLSCMITNPSVAKLFAGMIFPAGLTMVVIAGGELFTGNCLLFIPWLSEKISFGKMVKNLIVVYFGNFLGAMSIVLGVYYSGQLHFFGGELMDFTLQVAINKCHYTFIEALILGVFCNFLVCIAVCMSFAGKTVVDKTVGLFFPIFLFVASGYEHSVANMYYIPIGILLDHHNELTWAMFFHSNLLPVTIGNIIGGAFFVAALYYLLYIRREETI